MLLHRGERYQAGRGLGGIFASMFRGLKPLFQMGINAGKKLLGSDIAKSIGSTALDIGKDTLKNVAADLIEGNSATDSLNKGLETAKSRIASQIRGSGKKRKKNRCKEDIFYCSKKGKFNLLE